jgi:predicted RNA-binding protein with PUA-like domain
MWLVKTEPSVYSFDDLLREGQTRWDGVKNPAALKNLSSMRKGDRVLIYHTGEERQVVGSAEVVKEAYADPGRKDSRLVVVDLKVGKRLPAPVTLPTLKSSRLFAESPLVRQGRLSVVPLTEAQFHFIMMREK